MDSRQSSFTYEELLACGRSELFGQGNAQLPAPPMLMFSRITQVSETGGCLLYTSPSPRDKRQSRMPSSA